MHFLSMIRKIPMASFVLWCICDGVAHSSPVQIRMLERAVVDSEIVKLVDIAELSGGTPQTRKKISEIDVITFTEQSTTSLVTHPLVSIRLLLAGFSQSEITISGAEETRVDWLQKRPLTDQVIIETIKAPLLKSWDLAEEDLQIRLTKPISEIARQKISARSNWFLKPFISNSILPGPSQIRFGVYERNQLVDTMSVALDTQITRSVPVANRAIKRGEAIDDDSVVLERRVLKGEQALETQSNFKGFEATRIIYQGQLLTAQNTRLTTAKKSDSDEVIVKRRSLVTLIATKGDLRVKLSSAQALDPGKQGDVIRVKNLQSGKTISGRVTSENEVAVVF